MKKLLTIGCFALCMTCGHLAYAQVPQNFKYQSIARTSGGVPLASANIGLRISIRDVSATGTVLYRETHTATTNAFGVFTISVGGGTPVTGTLGAVDWGTGAKFIEVEADFGGGTSYTSMGASQLLSVPYALFSANGTPGLQGPAGATGPQGPAGAAGAAGATGSQGLGILHGTADPVAGTGLDGEFYINTTTTTLFGPKAAGAWPTGVFLVGSAGPSGAAGAQGIAGPQGAAGANGLNVLSGTADPVSGTGANGEFYINTTTTKLFGPKAAGVWPSGVSLIGPPDGGSLWSLTGNSGTVDGANFIGTTDNVPLSFRVNNETAGRIDGSKYNSFFGYRSGKAITTGYSNTGIGYEALFANATGTENVGVGMWALTENTTGNFNVALGNQALLGNTSGENNTALGTYALTRNTTGEDNTSVGMGSLFFATQGDANTTVGFNSLYYNTQGSQNSALGWSALYLNTEGANNTAIGMQSLYSNSTGSYNTSLGAFTMANNQTGERNTAVGYSAGVQSGALANATAVGANAQAEFSNSVQLGDNSVTKVFAGTGTNATLIAGGLQITGGTLGDGKVLTSDADGVATWQDPAGGGSTGWSLNGNTADNSKFLGTTNSIPLYFKVNNQKAGNIGPYGEVFVGLDAGTNNTEGYVNTAVGYHAMSANTEGTSNAAFGDNALQFNIDGSSNTALGSYALNVTSGSQNTAAGAFAMYLNTTGANNVAMGNNALRSNTTGLNNTATGTSSLYQNTTGWFNTATGTSALFSNTGNANTATGTQAMYANTSGVNNVSNGYFSMYANTTGNENAAFGYQSLRYNSTGSRNVAVGYLAGAGTAGATSTNNTFIGALSGFASGTELTNATAIGYKAEVSADNSLVLGGTGAEAVSVGIGVTAPTAKLHVAGNVKIADGTQGAGKVLTSDANGLATWAAPAGGSSGWSLTGQGDIVDGVNFIGTTNLTPFTIKVGNQRAGRIEPTPILGMGNTFLGYEAGLTNNGSANSALGGGALRSNNVGGGNVALGTNSLYSNLDGNGNTALGATALFYNNNGSFGTAIGYGAMYFTNNTTTPFTNTNVAIGYEALKGTSTPANNTGNGNTAIGYQTLVTNSSGSSNTALGTEALNTNTTGTGNTALGNNADVSADNLTNATAIGYNSLVSASNSLVLGGTGGNAVKVGIGVSAPAATLDVAGNVKIVDGTQGAGKVLTSDANGVATWESAGGGGGWGLTGTAGTVDGTNFIGTTDNIPFNLRVNNVKAGRVDQSGLALGYQALLVSSQPNNTAIGMQAMFSNTFGFGNTAVGRSALLANIQGHQNTAIGGGALQSNTFGMNNTAIGINAAPANTTGESNVAVGGQALNANTTGFNNVGVGHNALFANTTGTFNTAIGSGANVGSAALTNATAIGYNAVVTASDMVRIGNTNVTSINGAVAFTVVSDARFKKDIQQNVAGLPFIMKLRPVTYHLDMNKMAGFMKTPDSLRSRTSELAKEKILQTGFIAQEVDKAANDLGYDFSGVDKPDNDTDYYGLRYAEFTVPLVKAVQEQQAMIDELRAEILKLRNEKNQQSASITALEIENDQLKTKLDSRLKKLEELLGVKAQK